MNWSQGMIWQKSLNIIRTVCTLIMAPTQSYFNYVGLIILEGIILDNYVTIFIVIFYKEKFSI